jgi:RNA polymerase sigma-70 factor (ECF subfamily)
VTPSQPDEELIARAQAGDSSAFAGLAERYRAGLLRFVILLIGDLDEAESVVQETYARALAGLNEFRPEGSFHAWIRGIALNLSRQWLRQRTRHARPTDPAELVPAPAAEGQRNGVLSGILRDEAAARIWLAVGQLPEAYREAVVLHYAEGLDFNQMSLITGVSSGTLRVRALRGRNLLRGELGTAVDTWLRGQSD